MPRTSFGRLAAFGLLVVLLSAYDNSAPPPSVPSDGSTSTTTQPPDDSSDGTTFPPTLDGPLRLLSATPADRLLTEDNWAHRVIAVTFSRPMTASDTATPPPGAITVDPAVPGSLRWADPQTLLYQPSDTLPPATRFTVRVDTTVTSPDGETIPKPYTWSFRTPGARQTPESSRATDTTLHMVSSYPADEAKYVPPDTTLRLTFDHPVDAAAAADYLDASGFLIEEVRNEGDSTLIVEPLHTLGQGDRNTLTLQPGLPSHDRERTLPWEAEIRFEGRPALQLTDVDQTGRNDDRFSPNGGLTLVFSTPVRFGEVREAFSFESSFLGDLLGLAPRAEFVSSAAVPDSTTSTHHVLPVLLEPNETYTLVLDGLRDVFGRTIAHTERTVKTRAAASHVHVDGGRRIIEAEQTPAIPLRVTDVASVQFGVERLSADEIVPADSAYGYQHGTGGPMPSSTPAPPRRFPQHDSAPDTTAPPVEATGTYDLPRASSRPSTVPFRLDSMLTGDTGVMGVRLVWPGAERDGRGDRVGHLHDDSEYRILAQVTRLGVTGKFSAHQNLILVTRLQDGAPVEDARVTIRGGHNQVHWQGRTDETGRVTTPGWHELGLPTSTQYAIVEHEGDVAFSSSLYRQERATPLPKNQQRPSVTKGTVFSDRGLYKPGQTVHLKGLVRTKTDGDWRFARDSVRLIIKDPRLAPARKRTVLDTLLRPSDRGSVHLDWSIPDEAARGRYTVAMDHPYGRTSGTFQVRSFRRTTFSVTADPGREHYVVGDFFEGHVAAEYLFGADVAGQPATVKLTRRSVSFTPSGFEGFHFGHVRWSREAGGTGLYSRRTTLDDAGRTEPSRLHLTADPAALPAELTWRGITTSPDRRQVSDETTATLHPGRYYVGLRPHTSVLDLSADSTLTVDVATVAPTDTPVADKTASVTLVRDQGTTETVVRSVRVTTGPEGRSRLRMTVPTEGRYRLEAESRDARGNTIRSATSLYASGTGHTAWWRDDDQIRLVAGTDEYAPGDTARLMLQSPYEEATALITVEREGILKSRVETLTERASTVELPIVDEYLPNVVVNVLLLKGRTAPPRAASDPGAPGFKVGSATLGVSAEQKHLRVAIEPDQETYRPGAEATVDLRLQDASGAGVPGEIAFSAADAGGLNLIDYRLPDPFDRFYGTRQPGVTTAESRADLLEQRLYGQEPNRTIEFRKALKRRSYERFSTRSGGNTIDSPFDDPAGGSVGLSPEESPPTIRTDFRPLAHWAPSLQTDSSGHAEVRFTLPQRLSTYRLMATAATESKFGAGQTDIVVTKPLALKPALPRFARIGDAFEAGVLVSNRSDEAGTARVTASSGTLTLQGNSTKTVHLDAGATREVRFDWTAPAAGAARVEFRARLNGETDAVAPTLPIKRPVTERVDATFASTTSTARETMHRSPDRVPGLGQFDVTLSSTALVGLGGAAEYLFEYPYGCLEQRTSRIRPLLAGDELLDTFDLDAFEKGNRKEVIDEWKTSLSEYWTGDGFSLWKGGDHVNEYVTGYVLMTLADAKEGGGSLPQPLTSNTIKGVERLVRDGDDRPDYYSDDVWRDTRAFLLYALARHGRVLETEIDGLADRPPRSVEGKSHLLRTLLIADRRPSVQEQLTAQLRQRIRDNERSAHLEAPEDESYGWIFSSDVRSTAFGLTALLAASPSEEFQPQAQRMIRYLMRRRQGGHWASTQDNAAVLTAFQRYVDAYEQTAPDFSATVTLAGTEILSDSFQGRTLNTAAATTGPEAVPSGTEVPLSVQADGTGRLYYSARLTTYREAPEDAHSEGLRVERTLQRLNDHGEPVGDTLRTGPQTVTIDAGDLVKVTVRTSSPTSRPYVVVDDALPAGLEPLNEAFATTNQDVIDEAGVGSDEWWGSFTHTEMHDDRVVLFADYLREGEHTYSYVARATTPGTFTHPPAEAEMMYRPETRGHTATGTLVVEPSAGTTAER